MTNTPDYDMGDIIRGLLGNTLDAVAKAVEPAIDEQIVDASVQELDELRSLAEKAARAQDELKDAIGDKQKNLRKLKDELKDRMLKHGLKELKIAGRPPIEITESSSRKPTRKGIIKAYQDGYTKKLTDEERRDPKKVKAAEAEGKTKALNLWNSIEPSVSQSLKIPDPAPTDDVESPY